VVRLSGHEATVGRNDWFVRAGRSRAELHISISCGCRALDSVSDIIDSSRDQDIGVVIGAGASDAGGHSGDCRAMAEPSTLSR
jgi:hypothetical protein